MPIFDSRDMLSHISAIDTMDTESDSRHSSRSNSRTHHFWCIDSVLSHRKRNDFVNSMSCWAAHKSFETIFDVLEMIFPDRSPTEICGQSIFEATSVLLLANSLNRSQCCCGLVNFCCSMNHRRQYQSDLPNNYCCASWCGKKHN